MLVCICCPVSCVYVSSYKYICLYLCVTYVYTFKCIICGCRLPTWILLVGVVGDVSKLNQGGR